MKLLIHRRRRCYLREGVEAKKCLFWMEREKKEINQIKIRKRNKTKISRYEKVQQK